MRTSIFIAILFFAINANAQVMTPAGIAGYAPGAGFGNTIHLNTDSIARKKWSFSRYSALSSSFIFSNGGSATVISAPMGLQVTRMLTNNWYAFANVSVAPAYISFNNSFINNGFNKLNSLNQFPRQNSLGVYTAASMGLMYVNDAKTFSISGSISIEKSSNPFLPLSPANGLGVIPARGRNW